MKWKVGMKVQITKGPFKGKFGTIISGPQDDLVYVDIPKVGVKQGRRSDSDEYLKLLRIMENAL